MTSSLPKRLLIWVVFFPIAVVIFCAIIYFEYNAYKVLAVAKCRYCGKRVKGQVRRKMGFNYTP